MQIISPQYSGSGIDFQELNTWNARNRPLTLILFLMWKLCLNRFTIDFLPITDGEFETLMGWIKTYVTKSIMFNILNKLQLEMKIISHDIRPKFGHQPASHIPSWPVSRINWLKWDGWMTISTLYTAVIRQWDVGLALAGMDSWMLIPI